MAQDTTEGSSIRLPMFVIATPGSARVDYFKNSKDLNTLFEISYIDAIMLGDSDLAKFGEDSVVASYAEAHYGRRMRPSEIGCSLSSNIARSLASCEVASVVVEDDARFIDPFKTKDLILKFIAASENRAQVLALYDGRLINAQLKNPHKQGFSQIIGSCAGAVAYAITQRAAQELAVANSPVRFLNDWPPTSCKYFVCNINQVTHGDFDSTIAEDNTFRSGNSSTQRLDFLLFISYFKHKKILGSFRKYLTECWIPRVQNFIGNQMFRKLENE